MKTLSFDTSTKFLSIACLEDEKVVYEYHEEAGIRHSEILIPEIKKILEKISWKLEDIGLIAVGLGPGSFTGLRIAVATVKGLSSALNCKIVGVPSMDAIVMNYKGNEKQVAPLLNAHKEKVYSCIYEHDGDNYKRLTDYMLLKIDDLLKMINKKTVFLGDGIEIYKNKLDNSKECVYLKGATWQPKAVNIARLGLKKFFAGNIDSPETIDPLYLYEKECNIIKHGKHNL